jgi:hypothetical protein
MDAQSGGGFVVKNVQADKLQRLEDLPNIGKSIAADLRSIGIANPDQMCSLDPLLTYQALAKVMGRRHDPCVLDTLISVRHFLAGAPAAPWWKYTPERKRLLAAGKSGRS